MPYVGGEASRMSDLHAPDGIYGDRSRITAPWSTDRCDREIELESFQRQMLTVPEHDRLQAGRRFMSPEKPRACARTPAESQKETYDGDFIYDYVEPGPNDHFEFGRQLPRLRILPICCPSWRFGHLEEHLRSLFRCVRIEGHPHGTNATSLRVARRTAIFRFTSKPDLRDNK